MKKELLEHTPDAIMFSSGSTVDGLRRNLSNDELKSITKNAVVASIGPSTSNVIRKRGLPVHVEAATHSLPGLIEALTNYLNEQGRSR
jgi:uroporphyrinogen III methyltransferase/synthase